jgi:nucleotide-binding universal stress UspA family protein
MKNVLLLIHNDAGQEARLQAALDLIRALSGHLHCLDVTPMPLVAELVWGSPALVYDESESEERNAAAITARLRGEDVAWTLDEVRGEYAACLADAARTADVVVLNRRLDKFPGPHMPALAGELLHRSEALILAVAEDGHGLDVCAPAVVGWDGSETVMHALRRAMPLLLKASAVVMFQAGEAPDGAIPIEEGAAYLSRHGVKPEIQLSADAANPAAQIASAAERLGAGYCLVGGFGHSRLREAIFGGVTRELLETAGMPLLIGH